MGSEMCIRDRCTLGNGTLCNIEVQRSNNDDHLRRARYNASVITAKETDIGTHFGNIPEVYVIYISEFDFLKGGRTIYHIEKVIKETGTFVDDGFHEIFVNTSVKYSLQGTTQGRYLTGGVPPVRFSM